MPDEFDVFLSHNTRDKPLVEEIGARLRKEGLRVWLDKWELRPGFPWQEGLEEGVRKSRAGAVFVGADGLGAWQEPEMRAFIARSRREKVPVIPVLVPGCPDSPQLTLFLEAFTWVDLREGLTEDGISRLLWGITGKKPEESKPVVAAVPERGPAGAISAGPSHPKTRSPWWNWGIGISVLGVVLTLPVWLWLRSPAVPPKPELYEVRVQVLDPQGQPVSGATVRTSAGNEPHLLPDGWWEIQIPAAKAHAGSQIKLWAEHKDWEVNQVEIRLGEDPNPQVEIPLKPPESWLRGRVVDKSDQGLSGVRISPQDGTPGEATTDAKGRFELKLAVPREKRVRLRSELRGYPVGDDFCYTGRDSCSIVLEKK